MAWLLAGVVEAGDPSPVHGGDRGDDLDGGDGDGDKSDGDVESVPKPHAEIEVQENEGNEGEDSDVEMAATSRVWEESITEALAKNAVKRKRAASFLHQLLITVRTRCSCAIVAVWGRVFQAHSVFGGFGHCLLVALSCGAHQAQTTAFVSAASPSLVVKEHSIVTAYHKAKLRI